jgi:hypothetical protein
MRAYLLLLFVALAFPLRLLAADAGASTDPLVVQQLDSDCVELMQQKSSAILTLEQQKSVMESLVPQILQAEAPALAFTPDQPILLRKGNPIFTDAETKAAYSKLKNAAHGRPMPVIVEYYKRVCDGGKMTALQQAIFVRLTLDIAAKTEKQSGSQ